MNLKALSLPYLSAVLLILLSLSAAAQQQAHQPIDSLLKKLAVTRTDTNKTKLLIQLGTAYLSLTRSDSSVFYAQEALHLSQKQRWQAGIVNSFKNLGDYYYRKGMFAQAHEYLDKGFHASLSVNNNEATTRLLSSAAAAIYYQGKNTDPAISYLLNGAEQYQKTGKAWLIPSVYMEIGAYNELRYHYSAALDNFNKGFQLAETTPHAYLPGSYIVQAAALYKNLHDYKKARAILLKAIAIYKKAGKKTDLSYIYFEMAQSYTAENDPMNAIMYYNKASQTASEINNYAILIESEDALGWNYLVLKKYDSAYLHTIKSLAVAKTKDTSELAYPLSNLGSIYRDAPLSVLKMSGIKPADRYEKSASLLILANSKAKNYNDVGFINDNLEELSKTYEKMHRYAVAFSTYKSYIKSKDHVDSLKNEKEVLLKEAQLAYTHKEDSLKYRQNITNVQLKQRKQQGYFFIAGMIALLLLSAFIGLNYCNQRKSNRLLANANDQVTHANHELNEQREEITAQRDQLAHTITELKAAQQQLIQSEKMASLGELTAGIAHEIQNPLNFVNNFSDVNREMLDELHAALQNDDKEEALAIANDLRQNEEKINHHGKRADSIVKAMLEHSRTSAGVKEPADLNKLADEYLRLAYHGLRAKDASFYAAAVIHFDENLPLVTLVPQDMGRALLNLFNNAFYAVQQKAKTAGADYMPTITVTTRIAENRLLLTVHDNGNGISSDILDKVMQPFFTTKPTGEGTGLGLSLSYDIVTKAHGGQLTVTSAEGQYTEFEVILPL